MLFHVCLLLLLAVAADCNERCNNWTAADANFGQTCYSKLEWSSFSVDSPPSKCYLKPVTKSNDELRLQRTDTSLYHLENDNNSDGLVMLTAALNNLQPTRNILTNGMPNVQGTVATLLQVATQTATLGEETGAVLPTATLRDVKATQDLPLTNGLVVQETIQTRGLEATQTIEIRGVTTATADLSTNTMTENHEGTTATLHQVATQTATLGDGAVAVLPTATLADVKATRDFISTDGLAVQGTMQTRGLKATQTIEIRGVTTATADLSTNTMTENHEGTTATLLQVATQTAALCDGAGAVLPTATLADVKATRDFISTDGLAVKGTMQTRGLKATQTIEIRGVTTATADLSTNTMTENHEGTTATLLQVATQTATLGDGAGAVLATATLADVKATRDFISTDGLAVQGTMQTRGLKATQIIETQGVTKATVGLSTNTMTEIHDGTAATLLQVATQTATLGDGDGAVLPTATLADVKATRDHLLSDGLTVQGTIQTRGLGGSQTIEIRGVPTATADLSTNTMTENHESTTATLLQVAKQTATLGDGAGAVLATATLADVKATRDFISADGLAVQGTMQTRGPKATQTIEIRGVTTATVDLSTKTMTENHEGTTATLLQVATQTATLCDGAGAVLPTATLADVKATRDFISTDGLAVQGTMQTRGLKATQTIEIRGVTTATATADFSTNTMTENHEGTTATLLQVATRTATLCDGAGAVLPTATLADVKATQDLISTDGLAVQGTMQTRGLEATQTIEIRGVTTATADLSTNTMTENHGGTTATLLQGAKQTATLGDGAGAVLPTATLADVKATREFISADGLAVQGTMQTRGLEATQTVEIRGVTTVTADLSTNTMTENHEGTTATLLQVATQTATHGDGAGAVLATATVADVKATRNFISTDGLAVQGTIQTRGPEATQIIETQGVTKATVGLSTNTMTEIHDGTAATLLQVATQTATLGDGAGAVLPTATLADVKETRDLLLTAGFSVLGTIQTRGLEATHIIATQGVTTATADLSTNTENHDGTAATNFQVVTHTATLSDGAGVVLPTATLSGVKPTQGVFLYEVYKQPGDTTNLIEPSNELLKPIIMSVSSLILIFQAYSQTKFTAIPSMLIKMARNRAFVV
ncbi:uncharacterized protein LOC117106609 isoform X2 [Anneissia japonica]|uniref:uncharacterized protein LOC117106609 isoform X2 n=1 Tax=Anneissia japonica TaxID=1529436 RepID=UPI001425679C|nr:uncharacterized protein LOC117106609 isoform X2 [Anneissia japonica]